MAMYEGFKQARIQTSVPKVQINLRYGGSGPPVLLLHGCPLTLAHRHLVGLTSPASTSGVGRHESSRQSIDRPDGCQR